MLELEVKDFDLKQVLECGQVFRFEKISDTEYIILNKSNIAHCIQKASKLFITSNNEDKSFWENYFDLNTDYRYIKEVLSKDKIMKQIITYGNGIHILRQDFEEMVISFIMSQNKQIPQIKQCIELYCKKFGEKISFQNKEYFSFPNIKNIPTLEELKKCKVGFRDKYLLDAITKINEGYFNNIKILSEKEQQEKLLTIKGIGPKVCNCIMLFGLNNTKRFPIDVWIKRKMQDLYFEGKEVSNLEIENKAKELFGDFKGFAQQYLFYAGISKVI
ncbi:DNA glycosylase [Thomasclavelia cocleata]|jgi:3-methyladenine DNA glycosylase/8-oxoguanine DNA glycosylase|uniref:DNA-3-methyladenine glycosylase family protein n=1 Tax=Thomasclavelia cocleata TaxID=69824 RepID=UPI00256F3B62|nr:DNA glycosylase [Thomasclavelia cocleata]